MHFDTATRQRWMRALAYSNADALNRPHHRAQTDAGL